MTRICGGSEAEIRILDFKRSLTNMWSYLSSLQRLGGVGVVHVFPAICIIIDAQIQPIQAADRYGFATFAAVVCPK
jgi:beta-phosphoglucomutase-like phosphatase (HAD superfamily)